MPRGYCDVELVMFASPVTLGECTSAFEACNVGEHIRNPFAEHE
jgi:hypothetical protein